MFILRRGKRAAQITGGVALRPAGRDGIIIEPKRIGALLRAIDGYQGYFVTKCALRLAPLVFVRPGELRKAQWSEIDLGKAERRIPAERMKMREQHIVPLSSQTVEILREREPLTNCGIPAKPNAPRYVFPSARSSERPISENAVLAALRRMGYAKEKMTGPRVPQHGVNAAPRAGLESSGHRAPACARRAQRSSARPTTSRSICPSPER